MTEEQRKALIAAHGLPATATDQEIMAAVVASVQPVADGSTVTPGDDGSGTTQPEVPATDPAASPAQAPAPSTPTETPAGPTTQLPEGMALIDQATLDSLLAGNAASQELVSAARKKERDDLLDGAIRAGKFPKSRRGHYETLLSADPEGTKQMLQTMASGLVPVSEVGITVSEGEGGEDVSSYPASWGKSVAAARRGSAARVKIVGD